MKWLTDTPLEATVCCVISYELYTRLHWMKPRWKPHCEPSPGLLEADIYPPLWSHRDLVMPDILILTHVKLGLLVFIPLLLLTLITQRICQLRLMAEKWKLQPLTREHRESGAGPPLAQPLGLAQGLLRCSKAPEHASETPSFTAWLTGPHTHTHLYYMLLIYNIKSLNMYCTQLLNDSKLICLVYWKTEWGKHKIDFSNYFGFVQYWWNELRLFDAVITQILLAGQQKINGRRLLHELHNSAHRELTQSHFVF